MMIPVGTVDRYTRKLRGFGYEVSVEQVQEWILGVLRGDQIKGGPMMFVEGFLKDDGIGRGDQV